MGTEIDRQGEHKAPAEHYERTSKDALHRKTLLEGFSLMWPVFFRSLSTHASHQIVHFDLFIQQWSYYSNSLTVQTNS